MLVLAELFLYTITRSSNEDDQIHSYHKSVHHSFFYILKIYYYCNSNQSPCIVSSIKRTSSDDQNFITLVILLDAELAVRDGTDHTFYAQFNKIDMLKHCIVVFDGDQPIACGAIRALDEESMEIKRMYVHPLSRKKGLATLILNELERWSSELGYKRCVLETGMKQPEAIALYQKNGYHRVPNYGPYIGVDNSLCFMKIVSSTFQI